jgi:hypothetical protein
MSFSPTALQFPEQAEILPVWSAASLYAAARPTGLALTFGGAPFSIYERPTFIEFGRQFVRVVEMLLGVGSLERRAALPTSKAIADIAAEITAYGREHTVYIKRDARDAFAQPLVLATLDTHTPSVLLVTYAAYMDSSVWRDTAAHARTRAQGCERCGYPFDKTPDVHHLHYRNLGAERWGDVQILDRRCHKDADAERKEAKT